MTSAPPITAHLGRVDGPVVPLAGPAQRLGQLDEALVQAEVVPHRVLPALERVCKITDGFESVPIKSTVSTYLVGSPEEGELGLQVLVDLVERELLAGDGLNGHDDEGDVAVRRLLLTAGACNEIRWGFRSNTDVI